MLAIIELGKGNFGISVNKGLLINPSYSLDGSNVVSVLGSQITRVICFDLSTRLFFFPGFFKSNNLGFCKD
jgi:hypothetical protein